MIGYWDEVMYIFLPLFDEMESLRNEDDNGFDNLTNQSIN